MLLLVAISLTVLGDGLHISGRAVNGPRDGFMLSVSERFPLPVMKAKILVELIVLAIGFLLGGRVFGSHLSKPYYWV